MRWVPEDIVLEFHAAQLAEHCGRDGLHDLDMLLSALARPRWLARYGTPDVFHLAAAYAYGIARNHPFNDGNKRTSLVVAAAFLRMNGAWSIVASEDQRIAIWQRLAAGDLPEEQLAQWLRENCVENGNNDP